MVFLVVAPKGTVVMVHGAGGGGWEYRHWKPVFERAGWKVVARDLVPAKAGLAKTTFDDYAAQVVSWGKGAKKPLVLIGASMGGPLALRAAETLKPSAIVLVNSVAPSGLAVERKAADFPAVVKWAGGPLEETRQAMPDSDESQIRYAWKRWRDESGLVMRRLAEGVDVRPPQAPVLVVLGEMDTDVPLATGRAIAESYRADVQLYAGTSHVGPLLGRRASEVAKAVELWSTARTVRR